MMVEITICDLVDGNRRVPARRLNVVYCDAVKRALAQFSNVDVCVASERANYPDLRALVVVHLGRRPGFQEIEEVARQMFVVKDIALAAIDGVEPDIGEWEPVHG